MFETKILLSIPLLLWIIYQDIKKREINNISWAALVLIGIVFFIYEIIQAPSNGLAAMFLVSLLGAMVFGFFFLSLEWWMGGDTLVLIGMATLTYNFTPFPLFIPIIIISSGLGILFHIIIPKIRNSYKKEVDIPFTVHIFIAYMTTILLFAEKIA